MTKLLLLLFLILSLVFSGCALLENIQQPQLTPLEIQNLETREYSAPKERVFASVMSVFQNLGYNIVSADQATGFISAKSLLQSRGQFTATAFIETIGNNTRVRLSFVKTTCSMTPSYNFSDEKFHYKKYKTEKQVLDAALYQNTFDQIDSELFVRLSHSF